MPLNPGQVLNNRYRIDNLLGQGGFGAVYKVWDLNMERLRALKENLETSPDAQRQFKREAQILGDLSHPNLPKVIDHFIIPGQGQYLVMDFVEGQDLQQMLEAQPGGAPLPEAQVLSWIEQVCDALAYMHTQNPPIIHRDIKPANIKITPGGKAVLVDFGIAKLYDPHQRTTMGARAGTPGYSPVEQYGSSGRTDPRSDVYSLGATLYTLLTGQIPVEVPERNMGTPLLPPRALNPAVSPSVDAAVMKAMQLLPNDRQQSMPEFKAALAGAPVAEQGILVAPTVNVGQKSTQARTQMVAAPSTLAGVAPATQAAPYDRLRQPQPWLQQLQPWLWIGIAVAAVALVAVFLLASWLGGRQSVSERLPTAAGLALQVSPSPSPLPTTALPSPTPALTPTPPPNQSPTPEPSATPTQTPTALPERITDRHGVSMALIPGGEFQMGGVASDGMALCQKVRTGCQQVWFQDEEPIHPVTVTAFYMDVYEVTNRLYAEFLRQLGNHSEGGVPWYEEDSSHARIHHEGDSWQVSAGYNDHPVYEISWFGAKAFCEWRGARLPTEAEWEKAARGGLEGAPFPWGEQMPGCARSAANGAQSLECGSETLPVGSYAPNGYGLYDMAGNVWEWVSSLYAPYPYQAQDGREVISASGERVVRGGSWYRSGDLLRTANRSMEEPIARYNDIGFRCAWGP